MVIVEDFGRDTAEKLTRDQDLKHAAYGTKKILCLHGGVLRKVSVLSNPA